MVSSILVESSGLAWDLSFPGLIIHPGGGGGGIKHAFSALKMPIQSQYKVAPL